MRTQIQTTQPTEGVVQYSVSSPDSPLVLVIRVEEDFEQRVRVSYSTGKPVFKAAAICFPENTQLHIARLLETYFAA